MSLILTCAVAVPLGLLRLVGDFSTSTKSEISFEAPLLSLLSVTNGTKVELFLLRSLAGPPTRHTS